MAIGNLLRLLLTTSPTSSPFLSHRYYPLLSDISGARTTYTCYLFVAIYMPTKVFQWQKVQCRMIIGNNSMRIKLDS